MKNPVSILLLIFALTFTISCEDNLDTDPDKGGIAQTLPLLSSANNLGMIKGFNASNPAATSDSIDARWADAVDAGMKVGRLQIDWPELEPSPNVFNKAALEEKLKDYKNQNLQTFLLISAYDSDGPVVPVDLEGRRFDDAELIERFKALMDWVIPMLVDYDGYLISISNEADNSFGEIDNLHNEILLFLQASKEHIHALDQNMAVTVTMAEGSLDSDKPGMDAIIEACDVACWNFYGAKFIAEPPYYPAQSESEIKTDIQRMLNVSGDKQVIIQELGMWSGNDVLNSDEEIQRRFFEVFFTEMRKEERMRAAYVFQLVDWSPETTDILAQFLEDEGLPQEFIDAFRESLETMGLICYDDGTSKAAWNEFLKWLGML